MATVDSVDTPVDESAGAPEWTETTRLMCAAAYLEGTFAQDVITEIVEEPFRAVRVPEGVDVVPVAKHCLAARRQKDIRDGVLAAILVMTVVAVLASANLGFAVLGFLAAWATVVWDLWTATFRVAAKRLTGAAFRPEEAPAVHDAALSERLSELAARQRGNVTVYSGFNPFAGAGVDHGGWSFAVDLRKGRERLGVRETPTAFDSQALYDAVTMVLGSLDIPGLELGDRVFVHGTDIRTDRRLLPEVVGRPVPAIGQAELARFIAKPTHRVRHYKCIQVVDWRGELVVSLFLRFSVDNGRLFTELSRFLLTPLRAEYRRVDGIEPDVTLRQALAIVGRAFGMALPLWLRSPAPIMRPLRRMRREAQRVRRVKRDSFFDYGAPVTALDRARSSQYTRYFQKLDREMYVKVLERSVLDTIVELLDRHHVDTSELVERRETIINNGVMVPGGSVQAHNLAVGAGAKIVSRWRSSGSSNKPAPKAA